MTDRAEIEKVADKAINSLQLNIHDKCPRCHGEECSYCEGYGYIYNSLGLETRHKIIEALTAQSSKHEAEKEALQKRVKAHEYAYKLAEERIEFQLKRNESLEAKVGELGDEVQFKEDGLKAYRKLYVSEGVYVLETLLAKMREGIENSLKVVERPGMKDPFGDSWKWLYRLQDLLSLAPSTIQDQLAEKDKRIKHLEAKEQVLFDIHNALGIKWGDDPYSAINKKNEAIQGKDKRIGELEEENTVLRAERSMTASQLEMKYWRELTALQTHAEQMAGAIEKWLDVANPNLGCWGLLKEKVTVYRQAFPEK